MVADEECNLWLRGQAVKTSPFHGGNTGSIPVGVINFIWDLSSAGRASALQAEGHRFEPYNSHHLGPVVQLVRTPACHAGGREFEPHPGRQCVPL